jgi:hypothetical protein
MKTHPSVYGPYLGPSCVLVKNSYQAKVVVNTIMSDYGFTSEWGTPYPWPWWTITHLIKELNVNVGVVINSTYHTVGFRWLSKNKGLLPSGYGYTKPDTPYKAFIEWHKILNK